MIRQRAAAVAAVVAGVGALSMAVLTASAATAASEASSTSTATSTSTETAAATSGCTPSDVVVVSRNAELTTVSVKLAPGSAGVSCDVSLHSYETQGPTWATSGTQTFLGFASVHLTTSPQTLTVPSPLCFGQVELVIGTTRFDGIDGPLPHYPNGVFAPSTVIAVQHVTKPCGSGSPSPSVSPTSTETSSVTPTPSISPSESVLPTSTSTETASPEASVIPSPSPSVLGITITKPPQQGPLPFTGVPVALEIGAGLALIGAGLLLLTNRFWLRRGSH